MRIHTSLNYRQMRDVARVSGAPVSFEKLEELGSRTHDRAFEVALSGTGGKPGFARGDWQAATWDEWGAFFGALYDADIDARCGGSVEHPVYRDAEHFHFKTGSRFRNYAARGYLPTDTHARHLWEYTGNGFACKKCTAARPHPIEADAYAPRVYVVNQES